MPNFGAQCVTSVISSAEHALSASVTHAASLFWTECRCILLKGVTSWSHYLLHRKNIMTATVVAVSFLLALFATAALHVTTKNVTAANPIRMPSVLIYAIAVC